MDRPKRSRFLAIGTHWMFFCEFIAVIVFLYAYRSWFIGDPTPPLGEDVNLVAGRYTPAIASSPILPTKGSEASNTAEHYEPAHRLQKRADGPKKKGAKKKDAAIRRPVPQPLTTPVVDPNAEMLLRYQKLAMEAYEEERKRTEAAAEVERKRAFAAAQEEQRRAQWAARVKAQEEHWRREKQRIIQDALRIPPSWDEAHLYAVENHLWDQDGLLDWDSGYNGDTLTLNNYYANDEAVAPSRKRPSNKKLRASNHLLNENDQDDTAFIKQLEKIKDEVQDEEFFAVEPYDTNLPVPGTFEQTTVSFAPAWEDVKEWHEYGVEKSEKPPGDIDNSFDTNGILSTASGRTSRNEMDLPGRSGLSRVRTPSQSLHLGTTDSYVTEDKERMINEPTNSNIVTTSQLEESILSVRRPVTPEVVPPKLQARPMEEEEQKTNIDISFEQGPTDYLDYVSVRPGNENRVGKENSANELYNKWAAAWKGPIYPRTTKDWTTADYNSEWKRVVRSEYGAAPCEKKILDHYGTQKQVSFCRLKKSGLYIAPGLSPDTAQKLDLFLFIGCGAAVPNIGCGTRHWYFQQKKVLTNLKDGSKAYQDIYIDVRFDLASNSPADAGLGHGGVGLPHVQLSYMVPSELSSYQPPNEREWYYHEFKSAIKADQNILGQMFTDTKFPFQTAWPKEWVQGDFIAPGTPWGQRKASGNDVPIPALNKLIPTLGKQRVILTTRGWRDHVLDRSSVGKNARILTV
ncbi:hypothetical protein AOL_s00006g485 [Orbilia oligospora ATCC 24927]|uniref:Uncharacterized protein n=1 Tax=Arthrobotrys oligospora (strain ATCC 24927 / CBS 115.81 / DSM 1491) TaxID=756982 RepID=G1X0T4_ARTOA|nr:hypothetical protein AOL_s00006g485 [Orbilia oligospora ATCC 24927]EGX53224.1 hypothetical protein AOL_s00006g485 [Orbilia oligospora ATCC 24927]